MPKPMLRLAFWIVLCMALALRLGWGQSRSTSDTDLEALPDQVEYLSLARNLIHGQGLQFVDKRFMQTVYAFRMPGYPLFLAACGGNIRVARAAQALLDCSTILAVFILARELMPRSAKWRPVLAMAIAAFNPMLIYFSGLLLSETLFVAMIAWGMVLLVYGFGTSERAGRWPLWLGGGLVLALSVLVRPSAGILPVVLGVAAALMNSHRAQTYQLSPGEMDANPTGRWPLPIAFTMAMLVGIVLTPWAIRNYRVLNLWMFTDTNSGITLYDGYNPHATGASDQSFVKELPQLRQMDESGRSKYLTASALSYARSHPKRVIELAMAKAARTWSPIPLSDQFGVATYQIIAGVYSIPFFLLALWGVGVGPLPKRTKLFLLLPAIYLTVVHALTIGSLRYRLPAEPALAVLAASALLSRRPINIEG